MEVGELSPEDIHLPNIFVDRIIVGNKFEKRIEKRTLRKRGEGGVASGGGKGAELRERIVRRAALEFKDGMFGEDNATSSQNVFCAANFQIWASMQ